MNEAEFNKQFGCGLIDCKINKQKVEKYEETFKKILQIVCNMPSVQCQDIEKTIEGIGITLDDEGN